MPVADNHSFFTGDLESAQKSQKSSNSLDENQEASVGPVGSTHEHAVFVVAINGKRIDFSQPEFQMRSRKVHFENGNGTVLHKHAEGVTIDYTLDTLGFNLTENCLKGGKQEWCEETGNLRVQANGDPVSGNYEIKQDDTVIVSYQNQN